MTSSLCQIVSPQKINGLSIYSPNITCNVRFRLRKKHTKPKYILVAYWEQSWGCEGTKRGEGYKYVSSFLAGLYPMSHIQLFMLHRGLSQAISQCFILRYLFKATVLGLVHVHVWEDIMLKIDVILWQHSWQYCVSILIMWISETM